MPTRLATVITKLEQDVLTITIKRPKVNALDSQTVLALQLAFKQAKEEERVRGVLLTGSGKNFSAGQDLYEALQAGETSYQEHLSLTYNPLVLQIRHLEKPVVAAINGACVGAGLGLALACDLRIAAEDARLVVGFMAIGLVPDTAVSLLLPALVGLGRATELAYLNTPLSAQQALEWGLVNRVVPASELLNEATAWARNLAQGPLYTFGLTKRLFNQNVLGQLEEALQHEAEIQEVAHHGKEHQDRLKRFLKIDG